MIHGDLHRHYRERTRSREVPPSNRKYYQYCAINWKRYEIGCNWNWYRNRWPWMTLNGIMTADARYICGSRASCFLFFCAVYSYTRKHANLSHYKLFTQTLRTDFTAFWLLFRLLNGFLFNVLFFC